MNANISKHKASKMNYTGNNELLALEQGAPNYNRMLVQRFASALPKSLGKNPQVLDFGAGIGALSKLWVDEGLGLVDCYEPDVTQCKQIVDRGLRAYSDFNKLPGRYDLVFTSNVIEHIEDDKQVLWEINESLLKLNGKLVIYVPAFQLLYSGIDKKVGHFRRYSKGNLLRLVKYAGYEVESCEYVDSLGFFAAFAMRLLCLDEKVATNHRALRLYDKYLLPMSLFMDQIGLKRAFGKNLLLVARKAK